MKNALISLCIFSIMLSASAHAKKLRIYTEEFPPFNFTENGKITGVSAEVALQVMSAVGVGFEIESLPWEQSYSRVQKDPDALIFSISRNSSREALFKWIGILTPTTYSAIALSSRSDIKIERLEDLRKYKIGTTTGDIIESWLVGKGFSTSEFVCSSGENATLKNFKNLLHRRIDVWPSPDAVAYYLARREGHSAPESMLKKAYPIAELSSGYYLAANRNISEALAAKIADALREFKQTDNYFKILAHWGIDETGVKTDAPIAKLVYAFRNFNKIVSVGYLAADTMTEHRNAGLYRKEMREQFVESFVGSFDQWREKYKQMQSSTDAMIIGDISDIKGWSEESARKFTQSVTKIPTGCVSGAVTDYTMFGFDGDDFVINMKIAKNLGQAIPRSYFSKAKRIIE